MEASVKLACLRACQSGFLIGRYLDARARAAVASPPPRSRQIRSVEDNSGIVRHPALFSRLKSWRTKKALQTGLPQYMILPQKTMVTLVNFLPQSMVSLKTVKGMGNKKADQFGPDLLEIIQSYCQEKNIFQDST
jgi:superfamily II DNA helicase RecQ